MGADTLSIGDKEKAQSPWQVILGVFIARNTALVLIGIVGVASLIGTLIPQDAGGLVALRLQGYQGGNRFLDTLGFYNLYHSRWFMALMVILAGTITICTTNRLFRILLGKKATVMRLSSMVAHYSMILILLGGIIGAWKGFSIQSFGMVEGEARSVPYTDFQVRLDKAEERYNPDGSIRDWYSHVTVLENGKPVKEKAIEVNHPLNYKGVSFYQASFRAVQEADQRPLSPVELVVTGSDGKPLPLVDYFTRAKSANGSTTLKFDVSSPYSAQRYSVVELPDKKFQLWMTRVPTLPEKINLFVVKPTAKGGQQILNDREVNTTDSFKVEDVSVKLKDMNPELGLEDIPKTLAPPKFWSGLIVAKKPGLSLVWIGFLGVTLGWTVALLYPVFSHLGKE
ncbi:MAG: cytochrome c biogenesis protein ResB [Chloroflexi bacterium]|nr:cytochrome c biogenesis protein ResB [Chloroflexota bacterium]